VCLLEPWTKTLYLSLVINVYEIWFSVPQQKGKAWMKHSSGKYILVERNISPDIPELD
jgi:hypothetical protein